MNAPLVGHLDPDFLEVLGDIRTMLRSLFQTANDLTLAVSGTGTAAMEAALGNLIEPGDPVLVCVQGYFGQRLAEIAHRYGGDVEKLEVPWGEVHPPGSIRSALRRRPARLVCLVHAETSTGALQPGIEEIASACRDHDALLVLDTVTSLGGLPVEVDAWGVDLAYSAGQKSLSAPPGLSPITVGERARRRIADRASPPPVFYLDLELLHRYWGDQPTYHHTAPISTGFALREALRLAMEEGLPARFNRHRESAARLWQGLEALGLPLLMPAELRLPTLSTPILPDRVDDADLRRRLRLEHDIEIAGGFGPLAGRIWRIGLMGESSRPEHVDRLLTALAGLLAG